MGGGGVGDDDGGFATDEIEVKDAYDGGAVTVNIRCSNGTKFAIEVSLESLVESFKSVLAQKCDFPAEQLRLIYKGRILKDNQTLKSYGLEAGHTVHLVRGFVPAASTTSPSSIPPVGPSEQGTTGEFGASLFPTLGLNGLGGNGAGLPEFDQIQQQLTQNPNMMREIMDLPLVQDLMNNPDVIRNMMTSNPQMREIIDRRPELGYILNDPDILHQTLEAARNPEIMREMMRNTDRALSNIESSPEGFNMLRHMYEDIQEPFLNATTMVWNVGNDSSLDPFSALLRSQQGPTHDQLTNPTTTGGETSTASPAPNINPLPNPWSAAAAAAAAGANQMNATATHPSRTAVAVGLGGLGIPGIEGLLGSIPNHNSVSQHMQNPATSQSQMLNNTQLRERAQNPDFTSQMTTSETVQQMMAQLQSLHSQLGGQQSNRDVGEAGGGTGAPDNLELDDTLMNMFNALGTGDLTPPSNSNVTLEERYATQLTQLQEMGFFDTRENLQALAATAGDVHAAVDRLLGNPGQ